MVSCRSAHSGSQRASTNTYQPLAASLYAEDDRTLSLTSMSRQSASRTQPSTTSSGFSITMWSRSAVQRRYRAKAAFRGCDRQYPHWTEPHGQAQHARPACELDRCVSLLCPSLAGHQLTCVPAGVLAPRGSTAASRSSAGGGMRTVRGWPRSGPSNSTRTTAFRVRPRLGDTCSSRQIKLATD